jgi:hypothetical protein
MAEAMGRAGHELVREEYTPEEHYSKLVTLYEGMCTKRAISTRSVSDEEAIAGSAFVEDVIRG